MLFPLLRRFLETNMKIIDNEYLRDSCSGSSRNVSQGAIRSRNRTKICQLPEANAKNAYKKKHRNPQYLSAQQSCIIQLHQEQEKNQLCS